mgnify:FL=1
MGKILVFGSSNADMILKTVNIPQKGETVRCEDYKNAAGGKGANQACACAKLGADTVFLSAVGSDQFADMVLSSLRAAGTDVSRVLKSASQSTGFAVINVDSVGENTIVVVPGANQLCTEEYISENLAAIADADICLVQLELPGKSVYEFIRQAKLCGKTVIFNPAPASKDIPDDIYDGLDYITPNETEIAQITGMAAESEAEIAAAAERLLEKGVKNVIVTIGSKGVIHVSSEGARRYPAYKVKSVDTTAAGDTFNAGLAVALLEGKGLQDAISFGNAAAGISVTRNGAQPSIPSREEVDGFIKNQYI